MRQVIVMMCNYPSFMYFYKPDDDLIRSKHVAFLYETTSIVFIIKSFCYTVVLYYTNVVRRPVTLHIFAKS